MVISREARYKLKGFLFLYLHYAYYEARIMHIKVRVFT